MASLFGNIWDTITHPDQYDFWDSAENRRQREQRQRQQQQRQIQPQPVVQHTQPQPRPQPQHQDNGWGFGRVFHDITHNPVTNAVGTGVKDVGNFGSKVYDQVNPFDNGRTWKQRTPTDTKSVFQQFNNDLVPGAASASDFLSEIPEANAKVFAGPARSAIGTVQGLSGLYDMATQGTLHPQQNGLDKFLDNRAKELDTFAKHNVNPIYYHGSQLATDLGTFALPAAGLTKAGSLVGKFAPKVADVAEHLPSIEKGVARLTKPLDTGNFGQRIAGRAIRNVANPKYQAANAAFTGLQAGKQASTGQGASLAGIGTNLAIGGLGFPVAGAVGGEIGRGVVNLADRGVIEPLARNTVKVRGTPQGTRYLSNLDKNGNLRTRIAPQDARRIAANEVVTSLKDIGQRAKQFSETHPVGGSIKPVNGDKVLVPDQNVHIFDGASDLNDRAKILKQHLNANFRGRDYPTADNTKVSVTGGGIDKARNIDSKLPPSARMTSQNAQSELDNLLKVSRKATPAEINRLVDTPKGINTPSAKFNYHYVKIQGPDGNMYEGLINLPHFKGAASPSFYGLKPLISSETPIKEVSGGSGQLRRNLPEKEPSVTTLPKSTPKVNQARAEAKAASPRQMGHALGLSDKQMAEAEAASRNYSTARNKLPLARSDESAVRQKTGSTAKSGRSQPNKPQLQSRSAKDNVTTSSGSGAAERHLPKPKLEESKSGNLDMSSANSFSKNYKTNTKNINKRVTPHGDFKQGRLDVQADVAPLDILKDSANSAIKALKRKSKLDYNNLPHIVEGTEKATTKQGQIAADRIKRFNDVVHALKTNLKGSEANPPKYLPNYYRHELDLSDPQMAKELERLQGKALERDVKSGDFQYAGINDKPRVFKTLKEAEAAGFKRKIDDPYKEFNNYANYTKNRIRAQAVEKHLKEADANSTGRTVGFNIRGGSEPIAVSKEAAQGFKAYEAPKSPLVTGHLFGREVKPGNIFDKGQNGIRGSLFSLGQFHQVNIGLLRAFPGLAARGHGLSGAAGAVKMFATAPVRKIGDRVIENAIKDGTAYRAAKIGMPYGAHYGNEGSGILHGMFERQMNVMHDTVARNILKDLDKRGISLDSKEAKQLGSVGNNMMGHINWEMGNVSPGMRKAINRSVLASQFTPSKFSLMAKALSERGLAGSYARRAIAANVAATFVLTFAAGYLLHQKSDDIRDMLIRSVFDPSIPTPWKDDKGNTLKVRLPGTDTSDIARLLGITLSRGESGHLSIGWNPHDAPGAIQEFMRNRLSPALSAGVKIKTNTTFANMPLYDPHASFGTKVGQGAAGIAGDLLPIGLQGLPQLNALNKHLPKSIREVEQAHRPGNNPLVKSLASSFGFTPESDATVGKRLHSARYFDAVDAARDSLSTKKAKDAFDLNVHSKKNPVTGKYQEKPSVNDTRAKASALLSSPQAFNALYKMNQKLAKEGEKVDPLWKQSKDKVKSYLAYQTMPVGGADKTDWYNKNKSWYSPLSKARGGFFDSLPPGDPDKPQLAKQFQYPTKPKSVDTYNNMTNDDAKGNFLDNHPEVIKYWDQKAQVENNWRAAQGLAPLKSYPAVSKDVQAFMDSYFAPNMTKASKKAMRNSNPTEYRKMIAHFDAVDLYNVNKQGAISTLKGEPDYTNKSAKAIKNLGEDFYVDQYGDYHLIPAGWMLGLGDGGWGSYKSPAEKLAEQKAKLNINSHKTVNLSSLPSKSLANLTYKQPSLKKIGNGGLLSVNYRPKVSVR